MDDVTALTMAGVMADGSVADWAALTAAPTANKWDVETAGS